MKNIKYTIVLLVLISILTSCTDPYILKTNNYDEAIVIEATITNELKHQEVKITKTYRLEENAPTIVTDAVVIVSDNLGNNYEFVQVNDTYLSVNEFQAQPNVDYHLKIITDDGKTYTSNNETLTTVTPIQTIIPAVVTKEGIKGVDLVVNSFDPTNNSKYYRFEYEETNKIIAPKWNSEKAIATIFPGDPNPPGEILIEPRTSEARVCYSSKKSDKIILTSTNDLTEDRVNYSVRFIKSSDYLIANRYSILVKQYVQNLAAFTYYKTLKELSGSESILSQNQPGFFSGNIKCVENPDEKVIGFFDVSSYSTKRIFFNFHDVFPGDPFPKYPYNCPEITNDNKSEYVFQFCFGHALECQGFNMLSWIYYNQKVCTECALPVMTLYPTQCGDCTSFSSNIIPSFWID